MVVDRYKCGAKPGCKYRSKLGNCGFVVYWNPTRYLRKDDALDYKPCLFQIDRLNKKEVKK